MKLVSECATSSSFRVHKNGSLGFFIKCVVFHTFAVFFSFRVNFLYILNEVDSVARTLNNSYSLSHILTFSWILSISNTRCMSYTTLLCTNGMFCCYSRQAKVFLQSVWKQKTLNKAEHGLRFGKTKSQPAVCVCIYVSACVLPETACLLSTAVLSLSSRNCVVAFSSLSHRHTDTHTHKTYTHTHKTYTHTHTHTNTQNIYTHTNTQNIHTHTHTHCVTFSLLWRQQQSLIPVAWTVPTQCSSGLGRLNCRLASLASEKIGWGSNFTSHPTVLACTSGYLKICTVLEELLPILLYCCSQIVYFVWCSVQTYSRGQSKTRCHIECLHIKWNKMNYIIHTLRWTCETKSNFFTSYWKKWPLPIFPLSQVSTFFNSSSLKRQPTVFHLLIWFDLILRVNPVLKLKEQMSGFY